MRRWCPILRDFIDEPKPARKIVSHIIEPKPELPAETVRRNKAIMSTPITPIKSGYYWIIKRRRDND